jgi:hypothetical protein
MMVMGLSLTHKTVTTRGQSLWVNAIDTRTSAGGNGWLDQHFSQPFAKDNWNVLPSVSYISVSKYLGDNFSWVQGSVNKIDKYVKFAPVWQVVIQEEW